MSRFNKDIIKIESLASTNDFAKELLSQKTTNADITIIVAQDQTKGRGQSGSYWESEKGKNLTLSIIIKPVSIRPDQQFYVSMAVSLAIKACLNHFIENVFIKWPNDIYCKHKKICGILIENSLCDDRIESSIVGIGLNVNQTVFSDWIPNPTSLNREKGEEFDIADVQKQLLASFEHYYEKLINGAFEAIHYEYLCSLYLKDSNSMFKDNDGDFSGHIVSVTDQGMIEIVKEHTETRKYAFKEVQYLIPQEA
jgi:BirA family biotin operon repressor/biotin-[acetyl-CoA-carboxylase] ligase